MTTRILALDTSTEACSAAIWTQGEVVSIHEVCPQQHTQKILPMIEQVLANAGVNLNQIDAIAFGCGPGSFTGVRIGIGVAQGLALGCDLPMLPISTLKTLAQGAYRISQATHVLAAIDARMGEIYWGQYVRQDKGDWLAQSAERVMKPSQAEAGEYGPFPWFKAGTGWQTYPDMLPSIDKSDSAYLLPLAQDMLPLAWQDWQDKKMIAVDQVEPTYLRNEVTWKKLPGR